jgi:integral membrane protein
MRKLLAHPIGRLRVIGLVEGASFLLLLGIAMPLKYVFGMPEYVRVIGSLHGALWLGYLAALYNTWSAQGWRWRRAALAFAASVVPFGPFLLDGSLRAEQDATIAARPVRAEG